MKKQNILKVDTIGIISTVDQLLEQLVDFGAKYGLQESYDNFDHLIDRIWDNDLQETTYIEAVNRKISIDSGLKKVIVIDNYDRDWIKPQLVADNMEAEKAIEFAKGLNDKEDDTTEHYYMAVDLDYNMGGNE